MNELRQIDRVKSAPRFSTRTEDIASDGAAGWTISDAAAAAAERGEDVISLCLGDTSFDTPSRIVDAAIESLRSGRTHYSSVQGIPALRRAIADAQTRFDGQHWSPDQVTVFAGAQNALFAAIMCVAGLGDEVLYLEPWYATYEATIRAGGANAKPVKLSLVQGAQRVSERVLRETVTSRTRAILLNSPNNPGGYVLERADLDIIAEIAVEHNLWIISDEVYRNAIFEGAFVSPTSLPAIRERTIVVNSLSKSHAMTGWRVGWALTPHVAAQHLHNIAQCMLFGLPTFIQDAAAIALQNSGDEDIRFFSSELRRRRDLMCAMLAEIPQLTCVQPAGGMFCFVDVSKSDLSGTEFGERLFEAEGLAVVPGLAFGPNMTQYIRLSFSGSEEIISDGMRRLKRFCSRF